MEKFAIGRFSHIPSPPLLFWLRTGVAGTAEVEGNGRRFELTMRDEHAMILAATDAEKELRLLARATLLNRFRWRAELRRLRRAGKATPFAVHRCEMRTLNVVWRELRQEAGCGEKEPPTAVLRVFLRLAERKSVQFVREHCRR